MTQVAGVDLGKTGCRVLVLDGGASRDLYEGPGSPGLADPDGVDAAVEAICAVLPTDGGRLPAMVVGAAGAEAAPAEARELARRLSRRFHGCSVGVTSDSVVAHAGALGGDPGAVVAVGTGSVALGVSRDGRFSQVDGWGPWLGDDGGGAWLGREALRAVLLAREGRGPATTLTALASARFGDLTALPRTLAADAAIARTTASFAPDVLAAAESGDSTAASILDRAARVWMDLAAAAAGAAGETRVALVGGLTTARPLMKRFEELLPDDLCVQTTLGAGVDGAALLARRHDLPHEARVVRVGPAPDADTGPVDGTHRAVGRADSSGRRDPRSREAVDVDVLATEQVRYDLADLDVRGSEQLVRILLDAEATVPEVLSKARPQLAEAVHRAGDALAHGGRIVYVGAGTPGRLAALDAAECPPTFGTAPTTVVAVLAGGDQATARAVEGAEDDTEAGAQDLRALGLSAHDLVVGITASGRTPYVLSALDTAREHGCATVAVVNNAGSPAGDRADVTVELLTGAEVLAGSTRLKAGSAQKVALNVISTGAMIRNGKTYGAWMVDVTASNEKLRRRARRILREATGVDDGHALTMLEAAQWRTKTALLAILAGVDVVEAQTLLDAHGGHVRSALAAASPRSGVEVPR